MTTRAYVLSAVASAAIGLLSFTAANAAPLSGAKVMPAASPSGSVEKVTFYRRYGRSRHGYNNYDYGYRSYGYGVPYGLFFGSGRSYRGYGGHNFGGYHHGGYRGHR